MIHCFIEGNVFVTAGVEKKKVFFCERKQFHLSVAMCQGSRGKHTRTLKPNTFPASLDSSALPKGALCLIALSNYFLPQSLFIVYGPI